VAQFNADGSPDTTFATNGSTRLANLGAAQRVLVDPQGRIYLIGFDGTVARLTPAGLLDSSFGIVKGVGAGIEDGFGLPASPAGLQSNGRLVIGGIIRDQFFNKGIALIGRITEDDGKPSFVTVTNGTLSLSGTSGDDTIQIFEFAPFVDAVLNGLGRVFPVSDVNQVSVTGGDGDDKIFAIDVPTIPCLFDGGTGRDRINGGDKNDTLIGGGGRDFIDGGLGADHIFGGGGNDQLRGQGGNDIVHGGPGNDYIEGNGGADRLDGGAGIDTVHGNAGNDSITANDGEIDSLFGDGGTDTATADLIDFTQSIEVSQ
jgi:Ca2+-binding RTX toxin-like protein